MDGPARVPLADRDRIDWHHHGRHQLVCPRNGVLAVSTPTGMWTVPPDRAVWIPAGVAHAHRAYGPTDMRAIMFDRPLNPMGVDQPTALAVSPLLREVIVSLTDGEELTDDERDNLERVALDQLRRATTLRLRLPYPADSRLRDLAEILLEDPTDRRTLGELGTAVGAGARTLSRLFREQTGMSFPHWRTQLRLHHSLTLIAVGESVTTTAAASGYSGPSAFIQAFRAYFGMTPGEYCRSRQGRDSPPTGATQHRWRNPVDEHRP
ncbi:helix-turn-helix transcriptional regulator [Micromonospora sp. NPDC049114]|uniref:AraC family transcriptional regulator n=1 Tax=unclassified Micromonospora TaxID=2617518 RepID=UPI0033E6379E